MIGPAHSSAPAIHMLTRSFFLTLAFRECQLLRNEGARLSSLWTDKRDAAA